MQHKAKRVGPMAARKLIGLLTSEDPLQAMDTYASAFKKVIYVKSIKDKLV